MRSRIAVLVGGAPVTRSYATSIGADGYAPDAHDGRPAVFRIVQLAPEVLEHPVLGGKPFPQHLQHGLPHPLDQLEDHVSHEPVAHDDLGLPVEDVPALHVAHDLKIELTA